MLKTQEELNGFQRFLLCDKPDKKKNICTSRTFFKEINRINNLKRSIAAYAMNCAEKLRKEKNSEMMLVVNTCSRDFIFRGKVSKKILYWDLNYNQEKNSLAFVNNCLFYFDGLELLREQARYALQFYKLKDYYS